MEKARFSFDGPRGEYFIKQKGQAKRKDVCSPGRAFGLSSDVVFSNSHVAVKINYRQKQFIEGNKWAGVDRFIVVNVFLNLHWGIRVTG